MLGIAARRVRSGSTGLRSLKAFNLASSLNRTRFGLVIHCPSSPFGQVVGRIAVRADVGTLPNPG